MTDTEKQTEDLIFEAATDVFIDKGMDGARMQDIADKAGINKALLHYYYRTKEKLFDAVFEMIASRMFAKFAPVFDEKLSLEDKIRFFFREHISFLQKNPRLPAFLLNEINRNPKRVSRFIENVHIMKLWEILLEQHSDELQNYSITEKDLPQIMTSIAALSVFPFAARGIFEAIFKQMDLKFNDYLEDRKEFAAEFVIRALKK